MDASDSLETEFAAKEAFRLLALARHVCAKTTQQRLLIPSVPPH